MGEVTGWPNAYSRSKQNSDAMGMLYQWGRKEPFTFATSSLPNDADYGKYPLKVYNSKLELIYQVDNGGDNSSKTPVGGVIYPNAVASSKMEAIRKPNSFYGVGSTAVISQVEHTKELWDYYWTSYSRGTDGKSNPGNYPSWHNTYLDGYIVLRSKSIYDPCPYGYRTPTNGTYNDINSHIGWTVNSYVGGMTWKNTWITHNSRKNIYHKGEYRYIANEVCIYTSTCADKINGYQFCFTCQMDFINRSGMWSQPNGRSVRCIEDA